MTKKIIQKHPWQILAFASFFLLGAALFLTQGEPQVVLHFVGDAAGVVDPSGGVETVTPADARVYGVGSLLIAMASFGTYVGVLRS